MDVLFERLGRRKLKKHRPPEACLEGDSRSKTDVNAAPYNPPVGKVVVVVRVCKFAIMM